jgi:hypothetical protein
MATATLGEDRLGNLQGTGGSGARITLKGNSSKYDGALDASLKKLPYMAHHTPSRVQEFNGDMIEPRLEEGTGVKYSRHKTSRAEKPPRAPNNCEGKARMSAE